MSEEGDTPASWKREKQFFRFFKLTAEQAHELLQVCPEATVKNAWDRPEDLVGSFQIHDGKRLDWIAEFISRCSLVDEDYGLFISLVTESDTDMVRVPKYALELSRRVGGVIDFSFTFVEPPDEAPGSGSSQN